MSNIRYRAILTDPGNLHPERPVQVFGNDLAEVERWAGVTLAKAGKDSWVDIFQTSETRIERVEKPKTGDLLKAPPQEESPQ